MNINRAFGLPGMVLLATGLAAGTTAIRADTVSECRDEAAMYSVPAEQFNEYVQGCVLSRGGYPDAGEPEQPQSVPDTGSVDLQTSGSDPEYRAAEENVNGAQ